MRRRRLLSCCPFRCWTQPDSQPRRRWLLSPAPAVQAQASLAAPALVRVHQLCRSLLCAVHRSRWPSHSQLRRVGCHRAPLYLVRSPQRPLPLRLPWVLQDRAPWLCCLHPLQRRTCKLHLRRRREGALLVQHQVCTELHCFSHLLRQPSLCQRPPHPHLQLVHLVQILLQQHSGRRSAPQPARRTCCPLRSGPSSTPRTTPHARCCSAWAALALARVQLLQVQVLVWMQTLQLQQRTPRARRRLPPKPRLSRRRRTASALGRPPCPSCWASHPRPHPQQRLQGHQHSAADSASPLQHWAALSLCRRA